MQKQSSSFGVSDVMKKKKHKCESCDYRSDKRWLVVRHKNLMHVEKVGMCNNSYINPHPTMQNAAVSPHLKTITQTSLVSADPKKKRNFKEMYLVDDTD